MADSAHNHAKPWYRARNITLALLALVACVAGWSIVKAITAVPGPKIDYGAQIQALTLRSQPTEGADAYPAFEKVLGIVKAAQDRVKSEAGPQPTDLPQGSGWPIDYSMIGDPQVHPVVYQASLTAIDYATQAGLYTELDAIGKAPRVVWPKVQSPLFDSVFDHLGSSRNIARMGGARMDLAATRGDWNEFARAFEHTLSLSRVCDAQGFLISRLVSLAIDSLALSRARTIIATGDVSEAALVRMLAAMDSAPRAPFADIMEAERLGMLDVIQQLFTDDGYGDGTLILTRLRDIEGGTAASGIGSWRIINVAGLVLPGKKATIGKIDEFFAGLKAYAAATPSARRSLAFQPDTWVETLPRKYAPLKLLAPAMGRAVSSQDQGTSIWNGTRVMLAVEIYKRRNGQYPESLEQLVPGVLKEIPKDPYAEQGYRYARLAPGTDPTGAGYTLYSVGADGKDEQGAAGKSEGSTYNASSPSGDYRFNSPK